MHRRQFGTSVLGAAAVLHAAPRDPVRESILRKAIPLAGVAPDLPPDQLRPLRKVLAGVQVLGVGECNHGTSEFQVFKDRLFRFLVQQMGYTIFALEASFSACKALNDYIVTGKGDRDAVLAAQGYSVWDTVEMAQQVAWMRLYNQTASPNKKVQLVGLDLAYTSLGRSNVLSWLRARDPGRASAAERLLRPMDEMDEKWPRRQDAVVAKKMLPEVQALARYVREADGGRARAMSPLADPVWDMDVIEQNVKQAAGEPVRTRAMGENLLRIVERYPGAKILVSAFNTHLAFDQPESPGSQARERLGKAYYAMAAEFGTGSFHTRLTEANGAFGNFHRLTPPSPPERSVPWYLMESRKGSLILPFANASPAMAKWLDEPQAMHMTAWALNPDPTTPRYTPRRMARSYDGLFFVESVRPTQPTVSGLEAARLGLRF